MRFSNGVTAALLSLSVEANSVRLPYVKRADNVTAGIPPPPGTYIPVPTFFSTNSTRSKGGATSYPLDLDTQTAYSVYPGHCWLCHLWQHWRAYPCHSQ
ncbi:hypothetical protein F4823DRAFT_380562 [Ustulina deusta]|nr:hypothetical protein F4823DRAFT_380562 [Ustulina deusta]